MKKVNCIIGVLRQFIFRIIASVACFIGLLLYELDVKGNFSL